MSKDNVSFATKLGFRVIYGACWLFGLLPWWFLYYVVAQFIYFVLYRVARYRLKVVRDNLSSSFPEKSVAELQRIERGFYHNLSEYFVDAIDLASITKRGLIRRCGWPAEDRAAFTRHADGRNGVTLLAHYGSWELLSTFGLFDDGPAMASAYKPLKSKVFNLYYDKIRNRPPTVNSIPSVDMLRFYMAHRDGLAGRPLTLTLVADQNAPLDAQSRWVEFLKHPTVFFHGGEKIARKFSLPVWFMHVRKIKRGHWEQTFEPMWDGVSPIADGEITAMYGEMLEQEIRRAPELWLWSHKRWKKRISGEAAREYNERYGTNYPE